MRLTRQIQSVRAVSQASDRTTVPSSRSIWIRPLEIHPQAVPSWTVPNGQISKKWCTWNQVHTDSNQPAAACKICPPSIRWTAREALNWLLPAAWIFYRPKVALLCSLNSEKWMKSALKRSWWIWRKRNLCNSAKIRTIGGMVSSRCLVPSKYRYL